MKLIIDIDSEDYDFLKDSHLSYNMDLLSKQSDKDIKGTLTLLRLVDNIKNGTPLTKGHGDLIDRSKLLVELECGIRSGNYEEGYEKYPHINDMDDCYDTVKYADTVIEADKGE